MAETNNIVVKKPPYKETIGAQYYCFNTPDSGNNFDLESYDEKVNKTETVKSVKITESAESTPIYGSGKVYDTRTLLAYVDIEVESLASDADDLAKMRGDVTTEHGLIQGLTTPLKPYFAYGKVVKLSGGNFRLDWYPKCQLVENNEESRTIEDKFEEQNDSLIIRAYAFDEDGKLFKNSIDSSSTKFPKGVTEEKFFNKPIITDADLAAIIPTEETEEGA